jgi:cobalt-precorrin 5A hydrolase
MMQNSATAIDGAPVRTDFGPVAVYALTFAGAATARRIADGLDTSSVFLPMQYAIAENGETGFVRLAEALTANFRSFAGHVVVAAAGIVVRTVAPLLRHKTKDPAVVVVDQEGRYAVSLLSGHLGGANELAREVADILGGQAVITTATDTAGKPSLDLLAEKHGLIIENIKALAAVSRQILDDEPTPIYDPDEWLKTVLEDQADLFAAIDRAPGPDDHGPAIVVSHETGVYAPAALVLRPPNLAVGLGCNRGTDIDEIEELFRRVLHENKISPASVAVLASIDAKKDEPGFLELARRIKRPFQFFSRRELDAVVTPNPSVIVKKHMGVQSVCEAAAILAARTNRLVVAKQKSLNATLAIAKIDSISSVSDPDTRLS